MKKINLALMILVLVTNNLIGQTRENRKKIYFHNQSDTIKKAIGWSYNSTLGEWIDYENVICNDKEY